MHVNLPTGLGWPCERADWCVSVGMISERSLCGSGMNTAWYTDTSVVSRLYVAVDQPWCCPCEDLVQCERPCLQDPSTSPRILQGDSRAGMHGSLQPYNLKHNTEENISSTSHLHELHAALFASITQMHRNWNMHIHQWAIFNRKHKYPSKQPSENINTVYIYRNYGNAVEAHCYVNDSKWDYL